MEGTAHRSAHEEPAILTLRKVYRDGLRPDRVGVLLALFARHSLWPGLLGRGRL
jgi:hypothetical protein